MNKTQKFIQAYQQAPWRVQLQWLGFFLLGVVLIAAIAGMYLDLSGRAAAAGWSVQTLEKQADSLNREINDLATKLAYISSSKQIKQRLSSTDMQLLDPEEALYIEVAGYQPKGNVILASPSGIDSIPSPIVQPQYTNSLWDWFIDKVWMANQNGTSSEKEVLP